MALAYDWDVAPANRGAIAKSRLKTKVDALLTTTTHGAYDVSTAVEAIAAEAAAFMAGATPMVQGSAVTAVATTTATDLTTAQTLANELKTTVNTILTRMRSAGVIAT
jgi:hypothetical protein